MVELEALLGSAEQTSAPTVSMDNFNELKSQLQQATATLGFQTKLLQSQQATIESFTSTSAAAAATVDVEVSLDVQRRLRDVQAKEAQLKAMQERLNAEAARQRQHEQEMNVRLSFLSLKWLQSTNLYWSLTDV